MSEQSEQTEQEGQPEQVEQAPRFGLRRGARFLESIREEAGTEGADEEWLSGLRDELGDDALSGQGGEGVAASISDRLMMPEEAGNQPGDGPTASSQGEPLDGESRRVPGVQVPSERTAMGMADAMQLLEERLSTLEEALARAAAACTVSRMVLRQAQAAPGDDEMRAPVDSGLASPPGDGQAPTSGEVTETARAQSGGSEPGTDGREAKPLARLITYIRRQRALDRWDLSHWE